MKQCRSHKVNYSFSSRLINKLERTRGRSLLMLYGGLACKGCTHTGWNHIPNMHASLLMLPDTKMFVGTPDTHWWTLGWEGGTGGALFPLVPQVSSRIAKKETKWPTGYNYVFALTLWTVGFHQCEDIKGLVLLSRTFQKYIEHS